MASRRCSLLPSLPRLLLLLQAAVLGAVLLHGERAMATRPLLLGIAEPTASPGAVAAAGGPGAAALVVGGGRPDDRSEAGAEVILAGFAAALIVVIFCYIRVTRESAGGGVGVGEKHGSLGGF